MPRSVPRRSAGPAVSPGPADHVLLARNTPHALEQLADRYRDRALRVAGSILASPEAVAAVVRQAARRPRRTRMPAPRGRRAFGPTLMGDVARLAVEARAAGLGSPGLLDALGDDRCRVVALVHYGRLSLQATGQEMQWSRQEVARELTAGVRDLAATLDTRPGR